MSLKTYLPSVPQISRETVTVLLAAFIISRFPKVKEFVQQNRLTVGDNNGNVFM
jgi:hypothetical protein